MRPFNLGEMTDAFMLGINEANRAAIRLFTSVCAPCNSSTNTQGQTPATASRREELRVIIHQMQILFKEAAGDDNGKGLVIVLNALSENRHEVEQTLVVWLDLIEVLVQNTERRYGSKRGRGSIKAAEVKAVLRALLRSDRFILGPASMSRDVNRFVIDAIMDWVIEAIVLMANRYGLWVDTNPEPQSLHARFVILMRLLLKIMSPLWRPIAWLVSRIWYSLRADVPLSPAVRSALKAVERDGMITEGVTQGESLARSVVDLVVWLGTHRDSVFAVIELVFSAVQEAEGYFSLTGPEKKAFARDLVLAVLDEIGFEGRVGLVFAVIDALIGGTIEAAVHIFNKREVFTHRA